MVSLYPVEKFAQLLIDLSDTDDWSITAIDGVPGSGKSCLGSRIAEAICKIRGTRFRYEDYLTYTRKEMLEWINPGKNQKPQGSPVIADELISMFFKRNWYEEEQKGAIELLNKCRDRHLALIGCVPTLWDIDGTFLGLVSFWIHVQERGIGYVFKRDDNPFRKDKWRRDEGEKLWDRKKPVDTYNNFICAISWDDWTDDERERYYSVRNTKKLSSESNLQKKDYTPRVVRQRNKLICHLVENKMLKQSEIAEIIGVQPSTISMLLDNEGKISASDVQVQSEVTS